MFIIMEREGHDKKYFVDYIKLYILKNYKEDITVSWFADKLFLNMAYLGQKFKKETGQSVNSYLNAKRIKMAKELADDTDMTWTEIAEKVGYRSYINFMDNFIRIEGQNPSDYRN